VPTATYAYGPAWYIPEPVLGTADATLGELAGSATGTRGALGVAEGSLGTLAGTAVGAGMPAGGAPSAWDAHFVDVKSFGARGDWLLSTGTGTDDTAAIQAAIDSTRLGQVNEGKTVLLSAGRYRTTAPLNLYEFTEMVGVFLIRRKGVNAYQGYRASSSIEFYGGPTDNAVQAIGSTTATLSKVAVEKFSIHDRRTNPTGGSGVYYDRVVNGTMVRHMDIIGFPTGSSVEITSAPGQSSDCVTIDDIWTLRSLYGVNVNRIDNTCLISDIKSDSDNTYPLLAMVRVGTVGACVITGVKHENKKGTASTILLDASADQTVIVNGVESRTGVGGPVVSITGTSGATGITLRGIKRSHHGRLVQVSAGGMTPIDGVTLPFWTPAFYVDRANRLATTGSVAFLKKVSVNNADYTMVLRDHQVNVTNLTAARTLTLPAPEDGREVVVRDCSGQAGTYPIVVQRATAPALVNGAASVQIAQPYGRLVFYSDGTHWFAA
jgi:hypothetical protein